ncbi:AMP-binding protein [Chitinivorax sp. B]|uniref:AMP-binding protein n=1 Tax=Chitinivorax sp. B TaxID=2502235 RepID=UPI0010F62720|nr:AMP-binding protein [Chitinivorax sp. B]
MQRIWQQHYPINTPHEINPDQYSSIVVMLDEAVTRYGDKPAFINLMTPMSYHELDQHARHFAAYLQQVLGLKAGDRIALMMPNSLQYPVAIFGALRAGLVIVNVNPLYTARELTHQLNDAGAQTILIAANFATTLQTALAQTPIKHIIVTELADLCPTPKRWLLNFAIKHVKKLVPSYFLPGAIRFKQALHKGAQHTLIAPVLHHTDIAFLQYTGGTTGLSKGAMLTHRNIIANVLQITAGAQITENEIMITALPIYHVFALVASITFFMAGGSNILITNPRDTDTFIKVIKDAQFTAIIGVNTLFNALLNNPNFDQVDCSRLRFSLSGGMATQEAVATRWQQRTGCMILEGYGLTEAAPVVSINPPQTPTFTGTVGLPLPSIDVRIVDAHGNAQGIGEPGELCVKGPNVMIGYWHRPEETRKVLSPNGWLMTGDIAQLEADGRIRIVDRKKDMILVSGFNVYPNEVENVIAQHAGVLEVAVIGMPHDDSGELVRAYIVKKDPILTEHNVIEHCRQLLTAYKVPKEVVFREDLPKTNVGKILRKDLRDEALAALKTPIETT